MRSKEVMMLHQQRRVSSGGDEAATEHIENHQFSDKENEDTDWSVFVQAAGNIYFIPAHLALLTSKLKTISC